MASLSDIAGSFAGGVASGIRANRAEDLQQRQLELGEERLAQTTRLAEAAGSRAQERLKMDAEQARKAQQSLDRAQDLRKQVFSAELIRAGVSAYEDVLRLQAPAGPQSTLSVIADPVGVTAQVAQSRVKLNEQLEELNRVLGSNIAVHDEPGKMPLLVQTDEKGNQVPLMPEDIRNAVVGANASGNSALLELASMGDENAIKMVMDRVGIQFPQATQVGEGQRFFKEGNVIVGIGPNGQVMSEVRLAPDSVKPEKEEEVHFDTIQEVDDETGSTTTTRKPFVIRNGKKVFLKLDENTSASDARLRAIENAGKNPPGEPPPPPPTEQVQVPLEPAPPPGPFDPNLTTTENVQSGRLRPRRTF